MVFTIAESSTLRGKCCDWDGWPGTQGGWQCKRGQCIAVAMYTGATVTDCADSVIAASPSPRPTYQIPRRALTFNFCCSTSPPTNCESFINLFFATSDSHLMPDLLDPSWSNCFQANPWSDEMLGIVLWPAMSSWDKKIFWSKNDFQCKTLSFKAQHVLVFPREYVCARSKEMQGWEVSRCGEMSSLVDGTLWQKDGRMCGISRDQPSHRPYHNYNPAYYPFPAQKHSVRRFAKRQRDERQSSSRRRNQRVVAKIWTGYLASPVIYVSLNALESGRGWQTQQTVTARQRYNRGDRLSRRLRRGREMWSCQWRGCVAGNHDHFGGKSQTDSKDRYYQGLANVWSCPNMRMWSWSRPRWRCVSSWRAAGSHITWPPTGAARRGCVGKPKDEALARVKL